MNLPQLFVYAGLATVYALAATVLALWLCRLAGKPLRVQAWPLVALTFFLLALAFHPFPDRATFDCARQGIEPNYAPMRWIGTIAELRALDAEPKVWLENLMVTSTVMNLVLSLAIGAACAPLRAGAGAVLAFGLCLSFGIELAQLTGLFGLYGCAYRQFDVDDLILNVGGIVVGFWIARRFYRSGAM